ncbi:hypothetical protein Q7O_003057 [Pectobacterium carotovorum subsp. carotovorum PCCS1]|nr:hypothetical protein [Pectobacterium carotovorum subsp. carotovorum PCCS1]
MTHHDNTIVTLFLIKCQDDTQQINPIRMIAKTYSRNIATL